MRHQGLCFLISLSTLSRGTPMLQQPNVRDDRRLAQAHSPRPEAAGPARLAAPVGILASCRESPRGCNANKLTSETEMNLDVLLQTAADRLRKSRRAHSGGPQREGF